MEWSSSIGSPAECPSPEEHRKHGAVAGLTTAGAAVWWILPGVADPDLLLPAGFHLQEMYGLFGLF
jgi:hypothetical protein